MRKKISIVGGGTCALIIGCELDAEKYEVSVFEKNAAPGRKFLVAGEGGLNLSHSEAEAAFLQNYSPSYFLESHFQRFSNASFITWINNLGIDTYIGSSGRVFPRKGIKPVTVLNAILARLKANGVQLLTKQEWKGFGPGNALIFDSAGKREERLSDISIFAMGGASWPVTGSTGEWTSCFEKKDIVIVPFEASNCSLKISWPAQLLPVIEGQALKNCRFSCGEKSQVGEIVLTAEGIEGSGIYPLSPRIRDQLKGSGVAILLVDLKPSLNKEDLLSKLSGGGNKTSYTERVKKQLNLNTVQMALLKNRLSKEAFLDPEILIHTVKNLELSIEGLGPVENAISTVGGIALQEIDSRFELKKMPGCFVIGEMLDYDAPTGGYLLQSCFTMAQSLAAYLNGREESREALAHV